MVRTIIRPDAAGVLRDAEGHAYNDAGQRIDENGQIIVEVDQNNGVDRHQPGVDRHQPAVGAANLLQGAVGAVVQRGMTLGDYNRPEQFYANRSAIRPPPFQRNDFEIKPAYYTLVGQNPFHGLSHEHPMDHIERFEDLVTSIKANGVSYDYLFCKLFPYSLAGEAAYWLKQLKPGSLTSWEDTKNAFLNNFYDDARSEELRTKISTFSQGPTEAFKAAWVRFKAYQRDCPHHGFSEVQLLGIFFRGIDWRYQMALDAASNGNFNTRYPEDAVILIENLASSNSTKNADFERKRQGGSFEGNQIAEVKAKLDSMHSLMMGKKQVQFAAEVEVFEQDNEHKEQDVNFVSGTGFQRFGNSQGNHSGNQSSSNFTQKTQYQQPFQSSGNFTRNYGSSSYQSIPLKDKTESMVEQILEGQQKITVDFNGKIDALYNDLNGKFEALNTHVKKLDTQVAQTVEAVKRQENTLPGKTDANPRYACNAILLDGDISAEEFEEVDERFFDMLLEEIEDKDVVIPEQVSIDTTHLCRSTPAIMDDIKSNPDDQCRSTPLISVDRHPSQTDLEIEQTPKIAKERVCKSYDALVEKINWHLHRKSSWQFLEVHNFRDLPSVKKVIDKAYAEEICLNDAVDLVYLECATILQSILPEKLPDSCDIPTPSLRQLPKVVDPGRFVVPCSISGVEFKESLVDSGSCVNVISRAVAEKLRIDIRSTETTVTFANDATSVPYGTIPDLLIKVGSCLVPTDFVVVEMSESSSTPLILGRPFMATVGAVMDMPSERISFSYIDREIFYKAIPSGRASKRISCVTMVTGEILIVDLSGNDEDVEFPEEVSIDATTMCRSTPVATDTTGTGEQVSIDITAKDSSPLDGVDRHQPPVSIDTHHRKSQKVK